MNSLKDIEIKPMDVEEDSEGRRIVWASEILGKIKNGEPVEYDGVLIKGDLDLSKLGLDTVNVKWDPLRANFLNLDKIDLYIIKSTITITKSKIDGKVNLAKAIFLKNVNFNNTCFYGKTDFRLSRFIESALFMRAKFINEFADFQLTEFYMSGGLFLYAVSFSNTEFRAGAAFNGGKFEGETNFSHTEFRKSATFISTKFNGTANFHRGKFIECDANFSGAIFGDIGKFTYTEFEGNVNFGNLDYNGFGLVTSIRAEFKNAAIFWGSKFGKEKAENVSNNSHKTSRFNGTKFWDVVYFNQAKFSDNAEFRNAKFGNDAYFLDVIFDETVTFNGADISRLDIRWTSLENRLKYDESTILSLINNFKCRGYYDDADNCYYKYRKNNTKTKKQSHRSKIYDLVSLIFCGYGVRPDYTFWWIIALLYLPSVISRL